MTAQPSSRPEEACRGIMNGVLHCAAVAHRGGAFCVQPRSHRAVLQAL
jgi:hypothetical protein